MGCNKEDNLLLTAGCSVFLAWCSAIAVCSMMIYQVTEHTWENSILGLYESQQAESGLLLRSWAK